jgi:uncharacterized protein YndB with AHSA1/START domain
MALSVRTDAVIEAGEKVEVKVYQDNDGNGSADLEQELRIADGTNTYEYSDLDNTGSQYWVEVTLTPNAGGSTGYIFEEGNPVQAVDDAEQSIVFADGVPLTVQGDSDFIQIEGTAIGGRQLEGSTPEFYQCEILL